MRSSGKTAELEQNSRVELCYLSEGHDQVRITGVAERVTDRLVRQQIWDGNSLLRIFLQSIDNPEFMLYRVTPLRVRFMREWALEYQEVPF
jgi:general stress protein 26